MVEAHPAGIAILAIAVPWAMIAWACIWNQRNKYNIKGRGVGPMMMHTLIFLLFACYYAICNIMFPMDYISCYTGTGLGFFISNIFLMALLRLLVLTFRFRIAKRLASFSKTPNHLQGIMEGADGWYFRNRWLISRKVVYGTYAMVSVVMGVLILPVAFLPTCAEQHDATSVYIFATIGFWAIMTIPVSCRLKADDSEVFGIRSELTQSGWFLVLVLVLIGPFTFLSIYTWKTVIDSLSMALMPLGWCLGCWIPLWVAYHYKEEKKLSPFEGVHDIANLQDLLAIEPGYEAFLKYTTTEFAQENVLCWKAIHIFQLKYGRPDINALTRRSECLAEAEKIFLQFIHEDAPSQVNLPARIKNELFQRWAEEQNASGKQPVSGGGTKPATVTTPNTPSRASANGASIGSVIFGSSPPATAALSSPAVGAGSNNSSSSSSSSMASTASASTATSSSSSSAAAPSSGTKLSTVAEGAGGDSMKQRPADLQIIITSSTEPMTPLTPLTPGGSTSPATPGGGVGGVGSGSASPKHGTPVTAKKTLASSTLVSIGSEKEEKQTLTTMSVAAMFTDVKTELYQLMNSDLLPRFLKSAQWFGFLTQMKEFQAERDALKVRDTSSHKHSSNQKNKQSTAGNNETSGAGAGSTKHSTRTKSHKEHKEKDHSKHSSREPAKSSNADASAAAAAVVAVAAGAGATTSTVLEEHEDEHDHEHEHSTTSNPNGEELGPDDDRDFGSNSHSQYLHLPDDMPHVRLDPTLGLNPISSPGLVELERITVNEQTGTVKIEKDNK